MTRPPQPPEGTWRAAWFAVGVPFLLLALLVFALGVNMVIADELHYLDLVTRAISGGDWTTGLWAQHNEHRVLPMKLLMVGLAPFTDWSQRAEMFASLALTGLVLCVLVALYRASGAWDRVSFWALLESALLVTSVAQYENQFYGLMVCHFFPSAGAVVAFWALARRQWWGLPVALVAGVTAATSVGSGLLVFPVGLVLLLAMPSRVPAWRTWWTRVAWLVAGGLMFWFYFRDYIRPPHAAPFTLGVAELSRVARQFLATLGAPLAAGSLPWAQVLGLGVLIGGCWQLLLWVRSSASERERLVVGAGLLLFGLASGAMVGVGRAFLLQPGDPLGSRYVTHATLAWLGGIFLLSRASLPSAWLTRLRPGLTAALLLGLLAANLHGLEGALAWRRERLIDQYALQTFDRQTDGALARMGNAAWIRPLAQRLRQQHLSAFAEPQRLQMLLDGSGAVASADVRADTRVRQEFDCPVERLRDVGVLLLPAARRGGGSLLVTVRDAERTLARRELAIAEVTGWEWLRVDLPERYPCSGRRLTVEVTSEVAEPGLGPSVLTVVPYYDGSLSQGGAPIASHVLALALNAFDLGTLTE